MPLEVAQARLGTELGVKFDKIAHRRVFSCVHHGKPANKRKLTAEPVRKEIFNEIGGRDEKGQSLRQRTGYVC
jgi:hypothetical protein